MHCEFSRQDIKNSISQTYVINQTLFNAVSVKIFSKNISETTVWEHSSPNVFIFMKETWQT